MRPSLWATGVFVAAFVAVPGEARAWTDASVRSARATVELEDGARVRVTMEVDLRVDGGWLEAFELDGLDAGLTLDAERPPTFHHVLVDPTVEVDPETMPGAFELLTPRVTSHERGRIGFSFSRRHAPHRGDYRVEVTYVAPLATAPTAHDDGSLLGWTFPAWRFGLDGVEIDLILPAGSLLDPAFRTAAEGDAGVLLEAVPTDDGRVQIHLVRHHLPRTRSWPIAFVVPSDVAPVPEVEHPAAPVPSRPVAREREETPFPLGLLCGGLVLLALVLRKNAVLAREDREAGRKHELRAFARTLAAATALGGLCLTSWLSPRFAPGMLAVLALTGVHGPSPRAVLPASGAFRAASSAWLAGARAAHRRSIRGAGAWLRAHTPRGRITVLVSMTLPIVASVAWPVTLPPEHAALLVASGFVVLVMGRRSTRDSPLGTLGALLETLRALRLPDSAAGVAFLPVVYVEPGGRAFTARVRLVLAAPPAGLVRLDLALASDERLVLVAAARKDTDASKRLAAISPLEAARREREGFVLPAGDDLGAAIETLVMALTADEHARPEVGSATPHAAKSMDDRADDPSATPDAAGLTRAA